MSATLWHFGTAVLDERTLELTVDGAPVELEHKPLDVLRCLLRHAGEVVTKEELFEEVWAGRIVSESALTKAMSQIRGALDDREQNLIKTVHGYGYRLIAEVRAEVGAEAVAPQLDLAAGDVPPLRPHWRLQRLLGSGGQGEVWLVAHEKTAEQRVYKFALSEQSLSSLKREITLFRLLRNTEGAERAFVPILDWNLAEPPCYIELPYIPQGNLAEWAEAAGGAASIGLGTRIELLVQLADRLALAHSVGVLHKDLKPANVLIADTEDGPRPMLCDFGSGHLLDSSRLDELEITRMGFTRDVTTGSTSGTPLYLAPEVLAGHAPTVQADIYALGVLTYQLVVGDLRKSLAPGWEKDVDDELLRDDIAAAAAGRPTARLTDAAELARRLRTLEVRRQERAEEREATRRARRTRQLRRDLRRFQFAAAAMLVLSIAAIWASLSAVTARNDAQHAHLVAEQAAARTRAVSEFMNNELLGGISRAPQPEAVNMQTILDRAAGRINERLADFPLAAAEVHMLFARRFVTRRERALTHLAEAVRLYDTHAGASDPRTITARSVLGFTQFYAGRFAAAANSMQQLAEVARTTRGEKSCLTLLYTAWGEFAGAHLREIDAGRARLRALLESAADCTAPAAADHVILESVHLMNRPELARENLINNIRGNLVWLNLQTLSALIESETQARTALEDIQRRHGNASLHGFFNSRVYANLLAIRGQGQAAEELLEQYDEVVRARMSPGTFWYVFIERDRGLIRLEQGQFDDAAGRLHKGLAGCPDFENCAAVEVIRTHEMLAEAELQRGDVEAANGYFSTALELRISAQGATSPWTAIPRIGLARCALRRGEHELAATLLDAASHLMDGQWPAQSLYRAQLAAARAVLLSSSGEHTQARAQLQRARAIVDEGLPPDHWRAAAIDAIKNQ